MARDVAEYMRLWRQRNAEAAARGRAEHRARYRAQVTLASLHPEEFERLLDAERVLEGLPPVNTVKRGRPATVRRLSGSFRGGNDKQ